MTKKTKQKKFLFYKPEILNLNANWVYGSMKNTKFQLNISKLCLLGQKYPGAWDVNTTLAGPGIKSYLHAAGGCQIRHSIKENC